MGYLDQKGLPVARGTAMDWLPFWEEEAHVIRVRRGVYLNAQIHPLPSLGEVVPWLRKEAVVSLSYALGQAQVLKRYSDQWVTAVLPLKTSRAVGVFREGPRIFQFAGLRPDLLSAPADPTWGGDAYVPEARVATATPEKALLDWLYLARNSFHWRSPEPDALNWERLDLARAERLAHRMNLADVWKSFQASALDKGALPWLD